MENLNALIWKHAEDFLPHITSAKISNLSLSCYERKLRKDRLRSSPLYLKLDPGPFCQLRCPACKHADPEFNKRFPPGENLSLDKLENIVGPIKKGLIGVSLSHRGEPFLNPHLIDLIEYLHKNNISVTVPTNFSIRFDRLDIFRLLKSGLDSLYVSLDGASPETYRQYRVGGNFYLVLENVRKLRECRNRLGLSRPRIIWKFIVFDHNRHEIRSVIGNYSSCGFDAYHFAHDLRGLVRKKEREMLAIDHLRKNKSCHWLWHMMMIQSDGQAKPCCNVALQVGDVIRAGILTTWNNDLYRRMRSGFRKPNFPDGIHRVCRSCYGLVRPGNSAISS